MDSDQNIVAIVIFSVFLGLCVLCVMPFLRLRYQQFQEMTDKDQTPAPVVSADPVFASGSTPRRETAVRPAQNRQGPGRAPGEPRVLDTQFYSRTPQQSALVSAGPPPNAGPVSIWQPDGSHTNMLSPPAFTTTQSPALSPQNVSARVPGLAPSPPRPLAQKLLHPAQVQPRPPGILRPAGSPGRAVSPRRASFVSNITKAEVMQSMDAPQYAQVNPGHNPMRGPLENGPGPITGSRGFYGMRVIHDAPFRPMASVVSAAKAASELDVVKLRRLWERCGEGEEHRSQVSRLLLTFYLTFNPDLLHKVHGIIQQYEARGQTFYEFLCLNKSLRKVCGTDFTHFAIDPEPAPPALRSRPTAPRSNPASLPLSVYQRAPPVKEGNPGLLGSGTTLHPDPQTAPWIPSRRDQASVARTNVVPANETNFFYPTPAPSMANLSDGAGWPRSNYGSQSRRTSGSSQWTRRDGREWLPV